MQYGNRNKEIWLESSDSVEKPLAEQIPNCSASSSVILIQMLV